MGSSRGETTFPNVNSSPTTVTTLNGVAPSQQFTQYTENENQSLRVRFSNTTPGIASMDIPPNWQASAANLTLNNLQENRSWIQNADFNDSIDGWTFHDNSSELYDRIMNYSPPQDHPYTATQFYPSAGNWTNGPDSYNRSAAFITLNGTRDDWNNGLR